MHDAIPWQCSGIFASVTSGAIRLGELFNLGEKDIDTVLDEVRHAWSRALAREALENEQGNGHFIHTSSIIPYGVANWMAEVHFDHDEARYALIGEWIVPDSAAPLGWKRDYRVYQDKADRRCDMPGCKHNWHERKVTDNGYCIHLCTSHQAENANAIYMKIGPAVNGDQEQVQRS